MNLNSNSGSNDSDRSNTPPQGIALPIRGLPTPDALRDLAQTYLTCQQEYWPQLVGTSVLPEPNDTTYGTYAAEFENAYRTQTVCPFNDPAVVGKDVEIGAAYVRYSDAGSNVRSLDQQLINILKAVGRDQVFIPWQYVFADAAISATTSMRPGYQMLRDAIVESSFKASQIVVDELDRLNREQEDAIRFRKTVESVGKRLITAHGFDSMDPYSKVTHTITALQNEMHIDQLRLKVDRGMSDGFFEGKTLGLLPTGYKRIARLDDSGQPVINRKGKCEMKVIIDDEAAEVVRRLFEMYAYSKLSPTAIARQLNEEQAAGKNSWGPSSVAVLLKNERYIGIARWKKTRSVMNLKTGKHASVPRPESEHLSMEIPEMRIVSDELWEAVRKREQEVSRDTNPVGKPKKSRQAMYPTRLFDLYCQDCNRPLRLDKAGRYAQLGCPNGKDGMKGCTLKSSKALRIIDECLLAHLQLRLLDDGVLDRLLVQANEFLADEAAKPPVDIGTLDKQIRSETDKVKRLAARLVELDDGPSANVLFETIQKTESNLKDLKSQRGITVKSNERPVPIDMASMKQLLHDLRQLLNDDVVAAHTVLAKAVGRIDVKIGEKRGRSHAWLVKININPVPVLLEIAQRTNCPTAHSLEFLHVCSWTIPVEASFEINTIANYQRIAEEAMQMRDNGASYNSIAVALTTDSETVKKAIEWGKTNDVRFLNDVDTGNRRRVETCPATVLGPTVAKLRDEDSLTFTAIAKQLGTTGDLVSRAYKRHHADRNLAAVNQGAILDSGPRRKLSPEKIEEIRRLLGEDELSFRAIAREVGCTPWTVRHENKRMLAERADKAA